MATNKKELTRTERLVRSFTPEGMIIGGLSTMMLLLLFVALPSPYTLIIALFLGLPAFGILWAALESGNNFLQWLYCGAFGVYILPVVAAMFVEGSLEIPFFVAAILVFVCLELFHLHNLRMRNSEVDPEVHKTSSLWIGAITMASIVISAATMGDFPDSNRPSWYFVPMATFAIFAAVAVLTLGPLRNMDGDNSLRWNPSNRIPPAPADVDPLVAEAKAATRYQAPSNAPPPPNWESTKF